VPTQRIGHSLPHGTDEAEDRQPNSTKSGSTSWLAVVLHTSLEKTLECGLYPFVLGDTFKLYLAAAALAGAVVVGGASAANWSVIASWRVQKR